MSKKVNNLAEAMKKIGGRVFNSSMNTLSYRTGFPLLDYKLGYLVKVFDEDDKIISTYPALGISAGCFVTFVGNPSTGKTTIAIQIAANIVRGFANGMVVHFDLEEALNYTRIQTLTKLPMSEIQSGKYNLVQDPVTINDIKKTIVEICIEKRDNPETYKYDTGVVSEFNKPIIAYEPTIVIIDSIPNLRSEGTDATGKKELEKVKDISSQTDKMRLAAEISRFYTELQPWCKEFNVTIISINQKKQKINVGIMPSAAEIMYMKQDESLPGGKAPQYQAHIHIDFAAVGSEKYNSEEDGFDGYGIKAKIIKCRSNQNGVTIPMVYDKYRGLDSVRTSVQFAKSLGYLNGNRNGYYFTDHKEHKFTLAHMSDDFNNDRELYDILYSIIVPPLKAELSSFETYEAPPEELMY